MNNCERFKEARKELGLSQTALAKKLGVSQCTISKLETDDRQWTHRSDLVTDAVQKFFEDISSGKYNKQPEVTPKKEEEPGSVILKTRVIVGKKEEDKPIEKKYELTDRDRKTLALIEFAYDGLKEAKNDSEFKANIALMKRILNKY